MPDVSPARAAADRTVLIAGAGPTGLVLALWLTRAGVPVRIIDKAAEPGTASRALAVHARTLELYQQLGLAGEVVERGLKLVAANLWVAGEKAGRVPFGDLGVGLSPFPFLLIFPQDEHERLLIERLRALGVEVERRTELVDFTQTAGAVRARLARDGEQQEVEAAYLAGCDGARSRVRELVRGDFPGGTYARMFYVADIQARGPMVDGELHVGLDQADFLAVFPLKGEGQARLIGTVEKEGEADAGGAPLTWEDVSRHPLQQLRFEVARVNWFSTYRVHHRVAGRFREGRAFLLGDAAHIHSPVGGQGMNTGIGDALNLAWKLAAVLKGRAPANLLDTYEPERIAFARLLVETTDRAFTVATSPGGLARWIRLNLVPRVLPPLFNLDAVRRFMFRTVSQTRIDYRPSALSTGKAGRLRAGDRLPWVPPDAGGSGDNYAPLTALAWQLHVYGDAAAAVRTLCSERALPLQLFAWTEACGRAGLARDALYLVRPDGYLGFAAAGASDLPALRDYLDRWAIVDPPGC